jgi:helicase SWR1
LFQDHEPNFILPRAHRIGQIRDVHIYRFISQHTVEEAVFRKANQKRSLDDIVIQKGEFDWRSVFTEVEDSGGLGAGLSKALGEFEEVEDARAAELAAAEEAIAVGEDRNDFEDASGLGSSRHMTSKGHEKSTSPMLADDNASVTGDVGVGGETFDFAEGEGQGEGEESIADYMLKFVEADWDFFSTWRI